MENNHITILLSIILSFSFIILVASSSSVFGEEDSKIGNRDHPPIAHLTYIRTAVEGQLVSLDASRSFDPDGDPIKFSWEKISPTNLNIHLSNPSSPIASFVAPPVKSSTPVLLALAIKDDKGNTINAYTHVIVSKKTTVNQDQAQPVSREPHSINSVTKEDQHGKLRSKPPLQSPTTLTGSIGKTHSDSNQGLSSSQVSKSPILADNKIRVNAGKDIEAPTGSVVKLHGTILSNLNSKEIKLSWTQLKGPYVRLSSIDVLDPIFIVPKVQRNEKIQFELQASDQSGITGSDKVDILIHPLSVKERNTDQNESSLTTRPSGTNSSDSTTLAPTAGITATAIDSTPPTVVSTTPSNGASGIPVTASITAKFSEAIKSSTITTSSFILKNNAGTGIPGTISYISTDGKTATFKPSSSLAASTLFTVTVSPSTARLQDLAGNTMATKSWSFTTAAGSTTTTKTGLYVPLFTYPTSSTWSTLISTKKSHPNLPILATINPNSGVGSSKDTNFVNGINQLKSAGITVIGYVYTDYGQRSSTVIKDEIDKYKSWYGVNGIFFDEMSTTSGKESYYSSLNSYVKSSGMTFTMGNPGADTRSSYIGTVDNMIIYENQGLPSIDFLKGWHLNYDKKNFSIIPYGVSTLNTQFVNDAKKYVKYLYITNDVLPNPWNSLPSYLSNLAATLDQ